MDIFENHFPHQILCSLPLEYVFLGRLELFLAKNDPGPKGCTVFEVGVLDIFYSCEVYFTC